MRKASGHQVLPPISTLHVMLCGVDNVAEHLLAWRLIIRRIAGGAKASRSDRGGAASNYGGSTKTSRTLHDAVAAHPFCGCFGATTEPSPIQQLPGTSGSLSSVLIVNLPSPRRNRVAFRVKVIWENFHGATTAPPQLLHGAFADSSPIRQIVVITPY